MLHEVKFAHLPVMSDAAAVVFCGSVVAGCASLLPLGHAIELGGDEGFEVTKAFLCHRGFHLYSEIWSDQPPLFTQILAALFGIVGPSILWARVLTLVFSAGLLFGLFDLVGRKSGLVAAWSAVALLFSAPLYLTLSASVMQEVPAFSLAILSAAALSRWGDNRKFAWLLGSAVLFAAALMIKFTAALVLPAILVEFWLMRPGSRMYPFSAGPQGSSAGWQPAVSPTGSRQSPEPGGGVGGSQRLRIANPRHGRLPVCATPEARAVLLWAGAAAATMLLLALAFGIGNVSMLAVPHLGPRVIPGVSKPSDFALPASLFLGHWDVYLTAAVALWLVASKKLWREAAFPATLLVTVSLVHVLHRPWWSPYYLHHAIPLAWLAGLGVREFARELHAAFASRQGLRLRTVAAAVLVAVLAAQSATRLAGEVNRIRTARTIASDRVLGRIATYRGRTRWIYTQPVIYAFHAGIPVPPELAVLSLKRFWSGQMTWRSLLEILEKYHPEQMLLVKTSMAPEWAQFLKADYVIELDEGERVLYVAKALKAGPAGVAGDAGREARQ